MLRPEPLSSREASARLMAHLDAIAADPAYLHPLAAPIPRLAPDLDAEDVPPDLPWRLPDAPFGLDAEGHPWSETGRAMPHHVDAGGTAHWFAVVEATDDADHSHELRYFRAEVVGAELRADSHPVMPLETDDRTVAWPLPALEMELRRGDIFMAQQLAHDVAEVYDQPFPDPFDLPALDPRPDYYFGYGVGPHNQPSLEAVKTWMDGSTRRFDTFTIAEFDGYDNARPLEHELESLQRDVGLDAVMSLAEEMAMANRYLDPFRDDPRLFFEEDAPADPFTTDWQREQALGVATTILLPTPTPWYLDPAVQYLIAQEEMAHAALESEAWFQATFPDDGADLLQPLDETVNYSLVIQAADPHTTELAVEKYWREDDGRLGYEPLTLHTFDADDDVSRVQAEAERDRLLTSYAERGLTGLMGQAELLAMEHGWLPAGRLDPRLFTQGPPDRFETLAQRLEGEINPYWNTDGEKIEDPAPQPEMENPYWRLDTLPVNDLAGEPLGHALHMVVYPGVERDPDVVGSPAMPEDEPFRMLEMAHFETTAAADKFGKEFNGYLVPGLLDGPELAVEVARLEGLPVEWKTLEGDELKVYQNAELTLTHDPADWHPYNPNAERDARIATEGIYTDPIQQFAARDEPQPATMTPDFDL